MCGKWMEFKTSKILVSDDGRYSVNDTSYKAYGLSTIACAGIT